MLELSSPFVILVLANLSGDSETPLPKLKDRRLITVTDTTFCQFMRHKKPRVARQSWGMVFEDLAAFTPSAVQRQVFDQRVSDAVNADSVLRDPGLLALHATWRGLHYLTATTAGNPNVSVKVLDVSKKELLRDLQRAPEFDQSALFRKVYQENAGTYGGEPIGCMIGDYYLTNDSNDCELADKIGMVASAAQSPFLFGLSSSFFSPRHGRISIRLFLQNGLGKLPYLLSGAGLMMGAVCLLYSPASGSAKDLIGSASQKDRGSTRDFLWRHG